MKQRYLIISLLSLAIGLLIFFFSQGSVRAYGGDVAVVIFLYSLMSLVIQGSPLKKATAIFIVALAIEISQLFTHPPNDVVGELILGSSFDPYDLVAYVVALTLAAILDYQLSKYDPRTS